MFEISYRFHLSSNTNSLTGFLGTRFASPGATVNSVQLLSSQIMLAVGLKTSPASAL